MAAFPLQQIIVKQRLKIAFLTTLLIIGLNFFVFHTKPLSPIHHLGILGSCFVGFGLLLRSWAAGVINKNKVLTTKGPYSFSRHPLYLGSLFIAVGFIILIKSWYLWLILAFFIFFIYYPKIKAEEKRLQAIFEEQWDNFIKETSIFFPKRNPFKKIAYPWSFRHWVKHTEYNAYIGVALVMVAIYFWAKM